MARRDRSHSPQGPNKRVRQSHRSSRSPSPTRRSTQRSNNRSRYDDDWDSRDRDRDRYRDDRHRDDRRRDGYRDDKRDDRRDKDRRRSRSRSRDKKPERPSATKPLADSAPNAVATPPPEDEKVKARKEKLEAWKKEREAKKALDEAKAKAMALAGKAAPGKPTRSRFPNFKLHGFTSLGPSSQLLLYRNLLLQEDSSIAQLSVGWASRDCL